MTMMNPLKESGNDYLASLNNSYEETRVSQRGTFGNAPDGHYQAIISSCAMDLNERLNCYDLKLEFSIANGPYKGYKSFKNDHLIPGKLGALKNDLSALRIDIGGDITNVGEESVLLEILDSIVDISLRTRTYTGTDGKQREWQNTYINRKVGKAKPNQNFIEEDNDPEDPWSD